MNITIKLGALALLWATSANAATGEQLHEMYSESYPMFAGYVSGVVDGLYAQNRLCMPVWSNYGQASEVAARYLAEHPELRQNPAHTLVSQVLLRTWPCKP